MTKEHFTDGGLINRAAQGDRYAIYEVCEVLSTIVSEKLRETRFGKAVIHISKHKVTPNEAFNWSDKAIRKEIKDESLKLRNSLSADDVYNDKHLCIYIKSVIKALAGGRSPNDAFKWNRSRKGSPCANINVSRDWDIRESVRKLMEDGYNLVNACEIVSYAIEIAEKEQENSSYSIGYDSVLKIANGIKADSENELPIEMFPKHPCSGIKQKHIDEAKSSYKYLKIKK